MSTGVSVSDINWAFNERPLKQDLINHIIEIKEYYRKLNLRFWWWVYPRGQSSETTIILQKAGLRLFAKVPCMAADLDNSFLNYKLTGNIKVVSVKTKSDLIIWKDISFNGFEMPSHTKEQYGSFVAKFNLGENAPQRLFLAYFHDKPVATSLLFMHEDTAGIYYVSTLPDYRNKGCGLKVTQAAMQSAKESGFKDVILQATSLGARVYVHAGFKTYCQAEIYKI
ncbi:MAG: GNAT family N-acetyltransferase [Smithella sp.]|jgi:GNAT superfamily N-acetyltransferase